MIRDDDQGCSSAGETDTFCFDCLHVEEFRPSFDYEIDAKPDVV
jgi:hypothetical protein